MIPIDELVRTRRKSIALIVQPDGRLLVRAPLRASQAEILAVVEKHSRWILKKQAQARAMRLTHPPHTYLPGDEFWYLGAPRRLEVVEGSRPALMLRGDVFRLSRLSLPKAATIFRNWYRAQAKRFFADRVSALAARYGFQPRAVRVTSARRRWGSCSPSGTLAFSWRLMIAPPAVIDYVILHELIHLEIKNHSPAFWSRVQQLVPDYKTCVRWLKTHACLATDL